MSVDLLYLGVSTAKMLLVTAADVKAWLVQDSVEERLKAVPARAAAQDQICCDSGIKVDHEDVLYMALSNAVYVPVNEAAKHLGYALRFCKSHGKQNWIPA